MNVSCFEIPVDATCAGLMCAYELHVPTERGGWCEVYVVHNLERRTFEIDIADELLALTPQAITATMQLVMLELQRRADYVLAVAEVDR